MIRKIIIINIAVLLLFNTGCWNRLEPEERILVIAMGFDRAEKSGDIKIVTRIVNPQGLTGQDSGGGQGNKNPILVLAADGETPYKALKTLDSISNRTIDFSHTGFILFSEEIAREGTANIFDFLSREERTRLIVDLAVADGDLQKMMEVTFTIQELGGKNFIRLLETCGKVRSTVQEKSLREVLNRFSQPGWEVVLPRLLLMEDEEGKISEESPVKAGGMAVFKKDRMVGWLNEQETKGMLWVLNEMDSTAYVLEAPPEPGEKVTVEIIQSNAELKARVDGEEVFITVFIKADGRIQETTTFSKEWLTTESRYTESLERRLAQAVRNDVETALKKAQKELKSDVFGFGNLIYRTRYQDWIKLEDNWEQIYPGVKVEVIVEACVCRSRLTKDPVKIR